MKEITLDKQQLEDAVPFKINLNNSKTGEQESYEYLVARMGNKVFVKVQLLEAEFARDRNRESVVGSSVIKEVLERTKPATPKTPELIDLFDFLSTDHLIKLIKELVNTAKSSSVGNVEA